VQVFPYGKLKWVADNVSDPTVREHVSLYFYENPDKFRLKNFEGEKWAWRPDWHLSVDEARDFELAKAIFERFRGRPDFTVYDVIRLLDSDKGLRKINEGIKFKPARA
jgi:spore coat polysaccharide biosynthesis protein SpsF